MHEYHLTFNAVVHARDEDELVDIINRIVQAMQTTEYKVEAVCDHMEKQS